MDEFKNESGLEFADISSEEWREYHTPAGSYRIDAPLYLNVSSNGHRVFDSEGFSHYVDTRGGFFLRWKAKAGQPHFVK